MNITNQNNQNRRTAARKAAKQATKVAAWAALASCILSATLRGDDTPAVAPVVNAEPSPEAPVANTDAAPVAPIANADPAPVVPAPIAPAPIAPAPATAPAATAPDTKPVEPKVVEPKPVEPKVVEPKPLEPKVVEPKVVDSKPPLDSTTAPAATVPTPAVPTPAPVETKPAEPSMIAKGLNASGSINLMVNKSVVLSTRVPFKRVSIAQPDIATINLVGPSEILVMATKPGSTQLIIWDDQDHSQVVDVVVGFDLRGLEGQIKEMFPKAAITVESANGVIVLRGHVPDLQTAQKAVQVSTPYCASADAKAGGVLNFLEVSGGQQVMLQVRFAEVSRSVTRNLGFNAFITDGKFTLGFSNGPGGNPTGALAGGSPAGVSPTIPIFGSARAGGVAFEYFITALRSNNLLRTLAEPNLTAISGQQATFLAGGEIPILVPQASGGGSVTTIEYKPYGIQLNFTPTVLGDGRIRLQCNPQVSDLDYAHAVSVGGALVPALLTRNANTTVELAEGQTFALAGLLQNQIKASRSSTPGLSDLPVIGALFRSVSYERDETELVILVTPKMVEALNPNQVPKLPGENWRDPSEAELYFNADLGGAVPDTQHAPHVRTSMFYGKPGFNQEPAANPPAATPQK